MVEYPIDYQKEFQNNKSEIIYTITLPLNKPQFQNVSDFDISIFWMASNLNVFLNSKILLRS